MNTRELRADWLLRKRLQVLHDELVDGWNERVFYQKGELTKSNFHAFITSTCAELEVVWPKVFQRPDIGTPFHDTGPPQGTLTELCDQVLRSIGWRTDETAKHVRPKIGREVERMPIAEQ
jgi:hypothetical protein